MRFEVYDPNKKINPVVRVGVLKAPYGEHLYLCVLDEKGERINGHSTIAKLEVKDNKINRLIVCDAVDTSYVHSSNTSERISVFTESGKELN